MKRSVKITLSVLAGLLVVGAYFGYQIYKLTMGSEPLTGKLDVIPEASSDVPPLTEGLADWPNWRGPNFEGKSASTNIVTDWSKGLKKLWHVNYLCQGNATASWSAPVVKGNRLVTTGRDENNDLIFCLNSETGDLIWQGKYEAPATNSHGPGPRATPFIDDDKVYTFGRSGDLVCWQLLDGKMLWRKNVKDEGGSEPQWGYSSTPLVFEDKVIVQGGGNALALAYDKLTGNLLWKSMQGEAGYAAAIPMLIENEHKLLVYHGTGLSCLNPSDGKEIWTAKWETDYNVNATTPIISGDLIFHSSGYKMGGQALKVTGASYSALWKNNAIEAQHTDPVLIDGYLYSYSGESSRMSGQFKCVELLTGKEMWSTGRIGQGTATFADGHLICLDIKGNLYLVKPDPAEFKLVSEMKSAIGDVKHPAWTVPVVANGKLYLRYLQQLICYQLD
jgi:outer membrane protein assembly factor BamB